MERYEAPNPEDEERKRLARRAVSTLGIGPARLACSAPAAHAA